MEYAQKVVADIVARCKYHTVDVSETLAAFTARMIVHKSKRRLVLDQAMTADDEQYLVDQCVRVLRQQGEPALETVKMQLEFDFTYANLEEELRARRERKQRAIENLQRNISQLVPQKASDFETLTTLYKQIFTLLLVDADAAGASSESKTPAQVAEQRSIEKEVAAALESVFPRVGLKSFVTMSPDDKKFQLEELARIVQGIRLFNKDHGKGGAGMSVSADYIQENVEQLAHSIKDELQEANEVCTLYTEVLLHIHHHHKVLGSSADGDSLSAELSTAQLERWQDELGNRRQLLSYLQSLDEDISFANEKIHTLLQTFRSDLSAMKNLVGARTSLPKSHVYPLFEAVSKSWRELLEEHELLQTRSRALKALLTFKDSFRRSLDIDSEFLRQAKRSGSIPSDELFAQVETFAPEEHLGGGLSSSPRTTSSASNRLRIKGSFLPTADSEHDDGDDDGDGDGKPPVAGDDGGFPIRMPVDSTPEFMQLPLEYQGFCPWTVVERGGLLLPGDPSLGVVQYRNAYHVFVNERALGEFMIRPERYLRGVRRAAAKQPALIYLLRLQDSFPRLSLSALLKLCREFQDERGAAAVHPLLAPPSNHKVDASTSTPTHFLEKNIDFKYEWNEWRLRRRALQLANLRQCRTVSCQTQLSNFRREADVQVYLPKDATSQTAKERGTNPPRVTTYFAGLRGTSGVRKAIDGVEEDGKDGDDECEDNQAAVISFVYDP